MPVSRSKTQGDNPYGRWNEGSGEGLNGHSGVQDSWSPEGGARDRKGLSVCVCVFLRPHNPDELASKPHVNRLTTASVSTMSPVHSEGLVAMLGP